MRNSVLMLFNVSFLLIIQATVSLIKSVSCFMAMLMVTQQVWRVGDILL